MPTDQEIFDNACLGLKGQSYMPSYAPGIGMVVLDFRGRRCALGWSVDDALPGEKSSPKWKEIRYRPRSPAPAILDAHDTTLRVFGAKAWVKRMAEIAIQWGLDDSCLYFTVTEDVP